MTNSRSKSPIGPYSLPCARERESEERACVRESARHRLGAFAAQGMLEPIDCGPLYVCTGEVISAGIGGVIFILVLVGLLLALYCCSSARSKQQAALSLSLKQQLAKEDDADDFDRELKTAQIIPITLELQQVGLKLKATKKYVLRDVSAHFPNGSMVALMGASGSGKTTLMNTLLDRVPYGIPEGIVRVNGVVDGLAKAANLTGFVPQARHARTRVGRVATASA
eukprot:713632-Pleurochrysis_carterae.AAC.1